ncbi:hypothetical protein ACLOJK_032629 [Asimina triloba]
MKGLEVACFIALGLGVLVIPSAGDDGLRRDYYCETCPKAEATIAKMMDDFIGRDARVPARIIRMHFHDCFVRGCDASVLLNSTEDNQAERDAPANNPSLQGFELIEQIKQVLEDQCPRVVSCADIIAYAARESVHKAGKFERYPVRGGRKDGKISRASEVAGNIPAPSFEADALIKQFASKGLTVDDLVTLSGRQVNFRETGKPDPTLDPGLAKKLRSDCPSQSKANPTVIMDRDTPAILDNKYYEGVSQNKGLFTSDQTLITNKCTKALVSEHAAQASAWEKKFVQAMIKMGEIEVLTGKKGEIRKKCSLVNKE